MDDTSSDEIHGLVRELAVRLNPRPEAPSLGFALVVFQVAPGEAMFWTTDETDQTELRKALRFMTRAGGPFGGL